MYTPSATTFHSIFSLAISFRNQQFLFTFNFSAGSKQRATTMPDFEHVTRCSYLSLFSCADFNPIALIFLCVSHLSLQLIFVLFQTCHISSICPFFCPTVASNFYSSWDECTSNLLLPQMYSFNSFMLSIFKLQRKNIQSSIGSMIKL